ncbi:MAG: nitroreductase family protein, partial [Sphingobacterium sp.]
DRHVIYIDASLASMSFMLALETMGLSSCAINWPDIETREQKMDKFLNLKAHQRALMCIGVGYPDPEGLVAYSEKRPLDQIRKYN